jgi:hypothetical protein
VERGSRFNGLGILETTFDVNKRTEPKHIMKVIPGLLADLLQIPF